MMVSKSFLKSPNIQPYLNASRDVLLHVKSERARVTSDSGAHIRYTSRSRKLLGFATRRDVSADKQAHWYRVMQDSHEGRLKEAWLAEDGSLGIS